MLGRPDEILGRRGGLMVASHPRARGSSDKPSHLMLRKWRYTLTGLGGGTGANLAVD